MNIKQLLHTAFLQENSIKSGSAIIKGSQMGIGRDTILPITVAVSNNLPFAIAEKLARDYQVYVLQMKVQSITGVMLNEMDECGIEHGEVLLTESDDSRTMQKSNNRLNSRKEIDKYKASDNVSSGAPKNIFTLKPSWTKIEIPVANVETDKETVRSSKKGDSTKDKTLSRKRTPNIVTDKDYYAKSDGSFDLVKNREDREVTHSSKETNFSAKRSTSTSTTTDTTTEYGTRIGGRIEKMVITLATQAIGFQFSGKHLAYSFLSNLNKNVSEEFDRVYGDASILRTIKKFSNVVVGKVANFAASIADGMDNIYLSVASSVSSKAKKRRFNKRDAAQKIKESIMYTNIDWATIMLSASDLQGLDLTSSVVSNFSKKNRTNILVYDEVKRQVTMYVQSIAIKKSQTDQTQFAMTKNLENPNMNQFSAPVIVTYPDSQLGTFRYLNSVEVY